MATKTITVLTDKFVEARIRKGLSQTELGTRASITSGYVSQIENGLYSPSPKVAKVLAKVLGVDFDEIFLIRKPRTSEGVRNIEGVS